MCDTLNSFRIRENKIEVQMSLRGTLLRKVCFQQSAHIAAGRGIIKKEKILLSYQ